MKILTSKEQSGNYIACFIAWSLCVLFPKYRTIKDINSHIRLGWVANKHLIIQ